MKIGIMTYHRANNVGALLQNYALQSVLNLYGVENESIDYYCNFIEYNNRIKYGKNIKDNIKKLIELNVLLKREIKFNNFRNKYLKISPIKYDDSNIRTCNDKYDIFISGSDQVWNMNLNGSDFNYLLEFVKDDSKKYSYAASCGYTTIPKRYEDKSIYLLKKFEDISVREEQTKELLNNYNIDSTVVLDPTLLLEENKWDEIMKNINIKKKYVFIYMVAYTPELLSEAIEYAKENNFDIYCMHYNYKNFKNVKNLRNVSPDEFLYYIKNAEFIYCSSFHAVCFSIIFKKSFAAGLDSSKINNNSRLITLLNNLGLSDRILTENNQTFEEINYENVFLKLQELKINSFSFIETIVQKENTIEVK